MFSPPFRLPSLVLAIAGAVLVLAACGPAPPPQEPVRAVKVVTVAPGRHEARTEFAGEVKPRVESRLGFRVAGKLVKRQAEPGQRVRAGEVLAQLDPQDLRLAMEAARAQVAAATTSRDLAAADFKRFAALKEQNFISGAELERRESGLKAAQAQVEQAQAQLAAQRNQAGYATLVADVAGVVTAVEAEPGQVVSAGAPVVRVAHDGPRDVVFSVPEDKVTSVRPGTAVSVRAWAGDRTLAGTVREVSASADAVTRTFAVKATLEGGDAPPLGSTVAVVPQGLVSTGAAVIKLPTSALRQEGGGTAVWVLDKQTMTVKSQPVQVATADGNEAVIASGVQPGMLVVSAGVHVLAPGQKVTLYQDRLAPPAAANGLPQAAPGAAQAEMLSAAPARRP